MKSPAGPSTSDIPAPGWVVVSAPSTNPARGPEASEQGKDEEIPRNHGQSTSESRSQSQTNTDASPPALPPPIRIVQLTSDLAFKVRAGYPNNQQLILVLDERRKYCNNQNALEERLTAEERVKRAEEHDELQL